MTSISTQSATPTFNGLLDKNGFEIDWVEFNSPVWTGKGYSRGISVRQTDDVPSDRARCSFAEIVDENWRFVFEGQGAVLVAASNIRFIWTLTPLTAQYNMQAALAHIAGNLVKREQGQVTPPNPVQEPVPEPLPIPEPTPTPEPEPDPTADFAVASATPAPEAPVKRKRGRPRKNPLPETTAT